MPTLESKITAEDVLDIIEHARTLPADMKGDVVRGEAGKKYYRFSSSLVYFNAPNKDFAKAVIRQIYGNDNDVTVLRLGIIAVPMQDRDIDAVQADFIERLSHVDAAEIAHQLNILHDVKQPVYDESSEKNHEKSLLQRLNPFTPLNKESRITQEERTILEDIADIIASDGKYTDEERTIMSHIQQLIIEDDVKRDDLADETSEIGKLVAELRIMNADE